MRIKSSNGSVTIGGRTFSGDVRVDQDGTITVNGSVVGKHTEREISIVVTGDVEHLDADEGSVTISGSAGRVNTISGSVYCQDVEGDVDTMSGAVNCRDVGGRVSTMSGNIWRRAPGIDIDPAILQSKINDLSLALAFSLAAGDHAGARADVRKAQAHLEDLRKMIAGGAV